MSCGLSRYSILVGERGVNVSFIAFYRLIFIAVLLGGDVMTGKSV